MNRNIRIRLLVGYALLLVLTGNALVAEATDPSVTLGRWINYGAGIPNFPSGHTISAVAVDVQERLWIGTDGGGVAVYDGVFWTRYVAGPGSLVSDHVRTLATRGSSVWIGTGSGVSHFDGTDWTTHDDSGGLPSNTVNAIAFSFAHHIFATDAGLAECQNIFGIGLVCEVYTTSNSDLAYDLVLDVAVAQDGTRWVVTAGGVNRVVGSTWTTYTNSNTPGCDVIESATRVAIDDTGGRVWFGTDKSWHIDPGPGVGACMFDTATETWRRFHSGNSGLADDTVKDLALDSEGRVWIATDPYDSWYPGGVYVCTLVGDTDYWQDYHHTGEGLSSNDIRSIAASLDRMWFGTQDAGLSSFALHWGFFSDEVLSLASQPGRLWVGTTDGLDRFDGVAWTPEFSSAEVRAILPLTADDIWVGTAGDGVRHWDGEGWHTFDTSNSDLASDHVLALAGDGMGRVWMGTNHAGISVYNPVSTGWATFNTFNSLLASNHIAALTMGTLGHVWVGTDDGLSRYTGTAWETYDTDEGLPSNAIQGLAVGELGQVWAVTAAGAAVYDGSGWTTYTTDDGLPDDDVRAVSVDPTGKVWLGTAGGGAVYDGSGFTAYRARNSGLTNERVQAIASDDDGGVWFGATSYDIGIVAVQGGVFVRGIITEPLGLPAPKISSFSPASGTQGTVVTIEGTDFDPRGPTYNTVQFRTDGFAVDDWEPALVLSVSGTTTLTAKVPPEAIQGPIQVKTPGGAATSSSDFDPLPTITAIDPSSGVVGTPVDIYGSNLDGPQWDNVRFGTSDWNLLAVVSQDYDHVRALVPEDATTGHLQVQTASGMATSPTPFTVGSGGLKIFDWEVHQGLPQYPLVAGKSTVVRVFVGTDDPEGLCAYANRGALRVWPGGSSTPNLYYATIDNGGVPNGGLFCYTSKQHTDNGSIDFVIPGVDLSAGQYTMDVALSAGWVNLATRGLGDYWFESTGDLRLYISPPGRELWTDQTWESFGLQLTAFHRAYPVRDGATGLGGESGLQYHMHPTYQVCDGTRTGYCEGEGFLWDYWQEDPAGQDRACTVWNLLEDAQDNGSVITWDLGTMEPGKRRRGDFLARLRPGETMPSDPFTLVITSVTPAELDLYSKEVTSIFESDCGDFTSDDVIRFIFRVRNTGSESVEGTLQVDYDEDRIITYGPGGMILGSGGDFATHTIHGQFFVPEGSRNKKHDEPLDWNYNHVIDTEDLEKFVVEFDEWDPTSGEFHVSTDLSELDSFEVIRNFHDSNGNGKPDGSDPVSPYIQREGTWQRVVYEAPLAYMTDFNKGSPVDADFSAFWLATEVNPLDFRGLAGQAAGGTSHWADLDEFNGPLHELGHNTGLEHAKDRVVPGIVTGYDILRRRVITGSEVLNIMYESVQEPARNSFFEPAQYWSTFVFFRERFATSRHAQTMAVADGPVFYVSGQVTRGGEIQIMDSYRAAGLIPTEPDEASAYSLRFVAGNTLLTEQTFPVDFHMYDQPPGEDENDVALFHVIQPFPEDTTAVEITHGSDVLTRLEVSATPPQVELLSPNGGEEYDGYDELVIQWAADDPDGDALKYAIRYSADMGNTWQTLAAAVLGYELRVPLGTLPGGGDVLIEVEASDGFHTTSDCSNAPFSVGKKPPLWAAISAPSAGEQLVQSQLVTLVGSGYDLEDGTLSGDALDWSSDRDGSLESGDTLTTTLTVGEHIITLQASDSDGLTATGTITIAIVADFDGDGLSDAYESNQGVLDWWNPQDAGADSDGDGLTNRSEAVWGTDPGNSDSDGDGVSDGDEVAGGSSPNDPESQPEPAELLVSSTGLNFAALAGDSSPSPQEVFLISSTPQELSWTAETDVPWLSVEPISGTTPAVVAVQVDIVGLNPGGYEGQVTFQEGGTELTIPVHLAVTSDHPNIVYLPVVIRAAP